MKALSNAELAIVDALVAREFHKRRGHNGQPATYRQLTRAALRELLTEVLLRAEVAREGGPK